MVAPGRPAAALWTGRRVVTEAQERDAGMMRMGVAWGFMLGVMVCVVLGFAIVLSAPEPPPGAPETLIDCGAP